VLLLIDRLSARLSYPVLLLPFALYCAIVLVWLGQVQRYAVVSDNLITNANFEQGLDHWHVDEVAQLQSGDTLRLFSTGEYDGPVLSQPLDSRHAIVRFSTMMRVTGTPPGTQRVAGIFLQLVPSQAAVPISRFMEPHEWFDHKVFLQAPRDQSISSLHITVPDEGYVVELRDMQLAALTVQPLFQWLSRLLYWLFWALALIVAMLTIAKLWRNLERRTFWLIGIGSPVLLVVVLYFATTTRADLTDALHQLGGSLPVPVHAQVEPIVQFVLQQSIVFSGNIGAKLLHFAFFFVAGLVAAGCVVFARAWFLLWVLLVLTVGTETLQTFEVSRSGSFYDVGLNMGGLFSGFLLALLLLLPFRRFIEK